MDPQFKLNQPQKKTRQGIYFLKSLDQAQCSHKEKVRYLPPPDEGFLKLSDSTPGFKKYRPAWKVAI